MQKKNALLCDNVRDHHSFRSQEQPRTTENHVEDASSNFVTKSGPGHDLEILESIATMFAENELKPNLVEHGSFVNMMRKVSRGKMVHFPTQLELTDKIQQMTFTKLRDKTQTLIQNADVVSITLHLWSPHSKFTMENVRNQFLCIICHLYDQSSKSIKQILLGCRKLVSKEAPDAAAEIYNSFQAVVGDCDLDEAKIFKVVAENGSRWTKVFRYVHLELYLLTTYSRTYLCAY